MASRIAVTQPCLGQEEAEAVARVMASGRLVGGEQVEAFQWEFADYVGVKHALFTNSCTSALKMAYRIMGKPFRIVSPFPEASTYCATWAAGEMVGCKRLTPQLSSGPSRFPWEHITVAVHYGGVRYQGPCDIADSAHRIAYQDYLTAKIRCYSFHATKNMTTGMGGMFCTDDDEVYERAKLLLNDGRVGGWDYQVVTMSGGYDGDEIAAAIGRVQLDKLPHFTRRRNEIVAAYNAAFGLNWQGNHLYPLPVDDVYGFVAHMEERGIECRWHYPHSWNRVSIPLHPSLSDEDVERVIEAALAWG